MFKLKCECGKVIEGYTEAQVDLLMRQHKLSRAHIAYEKSKKNREAK